MRSRKPTCFDRISIFHSLSKTFVLQYHMIDPFVNALKSGIAKGRLHSTVAPFHFTFKGSQVFVNDERSRSFLGLVVNEGLDDILQLIGVVDATMKQFRLETYYDDPHPHASVASFVGQVIGDKEDQKELFPLNFDLDFRQLVAKVTCKVGNKNFHVDL
jgi:hypothetical protein